MPNYVLVQKSDYQILSSSFSPSSILDLDRELTHMMVEVPQGLNNIRTIKAQSDGEGGIEIVEDPTLVTSVAWADLRSERNSKLLKTDFTQLADSPCSSQEKTDWATYRTDLRDLPSETQDPTNPTWPTPPVSPEIEGIND
jgi:hypothetical protein